MRKNKLSPNICPDCGDEKLALDTRCEVCVENELNDELKAVSDIEPAIDATDLESYDDDEGYF